MKFTKKRTCNNCKALISGNCELGHINMITRFSFGVAVSWAPQEKCYKPMTNSDFIAAWEINGTDK
jgi:hypothetical protein